MAQERLGGLPPTDGEDEMKGLVSKRNLEFKEIQRNRFGRRWIIKLNGKIIHQGYNFTFGMHLLEKLEHSKQMSKMKGENVNAK